MLGGVVVAVEGAGPSPATPPIAVGPGVRTTGPGVPGATPFILRTFPSLPKAAWLADGPTSGGARNCVAIGKSLEVAFRTGVRAATCHGGRAALV